MDFLWLPFGFIRASASARKESLESARLESIEAPEGAPTFLAGGRMSKGALPLRTSQFDAAIYSSRGRGYARYNEDAAILFADAKGALYAAVFDQAGGLGGRVRGAASALASKKTFEAFKRLAADHALEPAAVLSDTFHDIHRALLDRREGEVTTGVAAILRETDVVVVNSGDSAAQHRKASGNLSRMTAMHEADGYLALGCLTHALGLAPEGPEPAAYRFELETGDWMILATDGFMDANLPDEELTGILSRAKTAEEAVNRVCTKVLRRMTTLSSKPDNLTVVAVRLGPR